MAECTKPPTRWAPAAPSPTKVRIWTQTRGADDLADLEVDIDGPVPTSALVETAPPPIGDAHPGSVANEAPRALQDGITIDPRTGMPVISVGRQITSEDVADLLDED